MEAKILVPLEYGGEGVTSELTLTKNTDLDPGLHGGEGMKVPMPTPEGERGFRSTAKLAHGVAVNYYGLSAGYSIVWRVVPCRDGLFQAFTGDSAGAAFLMALIKMRAAEFNPRSLTMHCDVEDAIMATRLEWVAVSASIDSRGTFGPVDRDALLLKLRGLVRESRTSGVRLAVISEAQQKPEKNGEKWKRNIPLAKVAKMPELFQFCDGVPEPLPVICAKDAVECYRQLFRLQSQQVLL